MVILNFNIIHASEVFNFEISVLIFVVWLKEEKTEACEEAAVPLPQQQIKEEGDDIEEEDTSSEGGPSESGGFVDFQNGFLRSFQAVLVFTW